MDLLDSTEGLVKTGDDDRVIPTSNTNPLMTPPVTSTSVLRGKPIGKGLSAWKTFQEVRRPRI